LSQNNRALRSNPNTIEELPDKLQSWLYGHKITEPYAQIPTNNWFSKTAPEMGHKITEPYAQIPTLGAMVKDVEV